ncbi:MAG: 16S rRNA (guanine(966)-N(2))-methyltransferase RsmD [Dorea sp.]|nr:16S rRNA (guanine(966)-N(2))-methyltransferase RsmD [Dorea sp.]
MRVIAGTARRLNLKTLDGLDTRPTTDRIKETLFNMIADGLYDCVFLDLFAGSGAIGIEALSRGAKKAVFVEKNPRAMAYVRENLAHTRLSERAETIQTDALNALSRLDGQESFDYIYMDPPYGKELEKRALAFLADSSLLAEDGVIIIEASLDTAFDDVREWGYSVIKTKSYKTNKHVFLERTGAAPQRGA